MPAPARPGAQSAATTSRRRQEREVARRVHPIIALDAVVDAGRPPEREQRTIRIDRIDVRRPAAAVVRRARTAECDAFDGEELLADGRTAIDPEAIVGEQRRERAVAVLRHAGGQPLIAAPAVEAVVQTERALDVGCKLRPVGLCGAVVLLLPR